jgi:hypothetical protein
MSGTFQGQSERPYITDWLVDSGPQNYVVANLTIGAITGATVGLPSGTCLEQNGTSGVYEPESVEGDPYGANGVSAILMEPISLTDLKAGNVIRACLIGGPATVIGSKLTIYAGTLATVEADLLALNAPIRVLAEPVTSTVQTV